MILYTILYHIMSYFVLKDHVRVGRNSAQEQDQRHVMEGCLYRRCITVTKKKESKLIWRSIIKSELYFQ